MRLSQIGGKFNPEKETKKLLGRGLSKKIWQLEQWSDSDLKQVIKGKHL